MVILELIHALIRRLERGDGHLLDQDQWGARKGSPSRGDSG